MIKREKYLKNIRGFYDQDLIKVITGIRRSGKSTLLKQIIDELKESGVNKEKIIYINFEDIEMSFIKNDMDLNSYIKKQIKDDGKYYLFFDEIQNLVDWQIACKTLRLDNNSLFITGSNSKLLSKEFTKELSGRYVSFQVRPFVYKEILEYTKALNKDCSVTDYLIWGGFPKRFEFDTDEAKLKYLNELNNTIVINDLINRYHIKKESLFKSIVNHILRSNARIYSAKSIKTYINSENENCSLNTIIKYLDYLEEAYIISSIKQYSTKTKKELSYFKKVYNEDVSFNSIRCLDNKFDLTHNLENIVYNELLYMGYDLYVFDNNGKEIDFLAQKGNKQYYVQVAYSVVEDKAYKREFDAFKGIDNLSQKIIITNDDIDYSTSTVKHIKLKDFLIMKEL